MPNHIQNRIQFDTSMPEPEFLSFLAQITVPNPDIKSEKPRLCLSGKTEPGKTQTAENPTELTVLTPDDFQDRVFDFNMFIKMPEELQITHGTETSMGLTVFELNQHMPGICCELVLNARFWHNLFKSRDKKSLKEEYHAYLHQVHPDKLALMNIPDTIRNKATIKLNQLYKAAQQDGILETYTPDKETLLDYIMAKSRRPWLTYHMKAELNTAGININRPDMFQRFIKQENNPIIKLGQIAFDNKKKYGAATWYDWCNKNWGTKWNAYSVEIDARSRLITFQTAWSEPEPIMRAFVEKYPNIKFTWKFASEDMGCGTGELVQDENGVSTYMPVNSSSEAYQFYIDCWGKDECLYQTKTGEWKHYDCDKCPHQC